MHARRIRTAPTSGPIDRRRLVAAGLSAVLPGLGQAFNRRRRLPALFLLPSLIVVVVVGLIWATQTPTRIAAWAVAPSVLAALLTLNVLVLVWRLVAVGQAFLDTRRHGPTGRLGVIGIGVLALLVAVPHLAVYWLWHRAGDAFGRIFDGSGPARRPVATATAVRRRTSASTCSLLGVDAAPGRTTVLTDTMMVVSLDPVGKTVVDGVAPARPRERAAGQRRRFRAEAELADGLRRRPSRRLPEGRPAHAPGRDRRRCSGIPIHYHATMDFDGFVDMVDAVGGVDVKVAKAIERSRLRRLRRRATGLVDQRRDPPPRRGGRAGLRPHPQVGRRERLHPGRSTAADPRRAQGRGDRRRQHVLEAPRAADGDRRHGRTDLPVERLPSSPRSIDEMRSGGITRAVIRHPLVRTRRHALRVVADARTWRRSATSPRSSSRLPAATRSRGRRRSRRSAPGPSGRLPAAGRRLSTPRTRRAARRGRIAAHHQAPVRPAPRSPRRRPVEPGQQQRSSSRRCRAGRSAWRAGRAGPTRRPRPAPRACPARRAAR